MISNSVGPKWPSMKLTGDPRLFVGTRTSNGRLNGYRIELHESLFDDFRSICSSNAKWFTSAIPREYEPYAALELGEEYCWLNIADLPTAASTKRPIKFPSDNPQSADLINLLKSVDALDSISVNKLRTLNLYFYAICWHIDSKILAFVKRADPRQAVRAGYKYFQYGDTLKSIEQPDLVLAKEVDLVVTDSFIASRSESVLNYLLSDVKLALESVPANVASVATSLSSKIILPRQPSRATCALQTSNRAGMGNHRTASREFDSARRSIHQATSKSYARVLFALLAPNNDYSRHCFTRQN